MKQNALNHVFNYNRLNFTYYENYKTFEWNTHSVRFNLKL